MLRTITVSLLTIIAALGFLISGGYAQQKPKPKPVPKKEIFTVRGDVPVPKEVPKTFGLTIERYVTNYKLNANGTGEQTIDLDQKCSSEVCLTQISKIRYEFNGELNDIRFTRAAILKSDGKNIPVDLSSIRSRPTPQAEAAPGFSSLREIELKFTDIAVNDTVRISMVIEPRKPIFN